MCVRFPYSRSPDTLVAALGWHGAASEALRRHSSSISSDAEQRTDRAGPVGVRPRDRAGLQSRDQGSDRHVRGTPAALSPANAPPFSPGRGGGGEFRGLTAAPRAAGLNDRGRADGGAGPGHDGDVHEEGDRDVVQPGQELHDDRHFALDVRQLHQYLHHHVHRHVRPATARHPSLLLLPLPLLLCCFLLGKTARWNASPLPRR